MRGPATCALAYRETGSNSQQKSAILFADSSSPRRRPPVLPAGSPGYTAFDRCNDRVAQKVWRGRETVHSLQTTLLWCVHAGSRFAGRARSRTDALRCAACVLQQEKAGLREAMAYLAILRNFAARRIVTLAAHSQTVSRLARLNSRVVN